MTENDIHNGPLACLIDVASLAGHVA